MSLELKQTNKVFFLLFFLAFGQIAFSQIAPEKYWIQFTDKNNSPFSISNPSEYLSQRAIDRRTNQNILITQQDFPVNPSYVTGVEQVAVVNVLNTSKWLNGIVIQTTDTQNISEILKLPFVDSSGSMSIETPGNKSTKLDISGYTVSNKKESVQDILGIDYGLADTQNKLIHIDGIHDNGYTGNGMVIAVLDGGFRDADTEEVLAPIFNNGQILGTWDFVLNQPVDYTSHSTHGKSVLICMGANLPGRYVGSAPDASYWLLRTEDAPTENIIEEYNWVSGAEFADSVGADVFNTSLGYTTYDNSAHDHTYADMDGNTTVITIGADIAASKGILVINSAGNSGGGSWRYIGAPADGDSVLAIGAIYDNETVTGFSSRGPSADGRVKPNVMSMGAGVPMPSGPDSVYYINGTSFSSPILAGAAACFWEARPGYTNMDIYHAIELSANRYTYPDEHYGYGVPNFNMAYFLITSSKDVQDLGYSISAYPNPTQGVVYIPINDSKSSIISVINILGTEVYQTKSATVVDESVILDLTHLSNGVYFVKVDTKEGSQIVRIVKE